MPSPGIGVSAALFVLCLAVPAAAQSAAPPEPARPDPQDTQRAGPVEATLDNPVAQDVTDVTTNRRRGFFSAFMHNIGDDISHLPRRNSVYWLAGGIAASLAVHPADLNVNRHLVGSSLADKLFAPGKYVGATEVQMATSLVVYFVARGADMPRAQHLAMDLLEAQVLTEGIIEGAKIAIRRQRPLNADGTRFSGYSLPSGHAAVTFATATVLQQHLGWKASFPTFALATYVATSRLHDNRHFLSDVVLGAATGIIVGRSVTWHGRNTYTLSMVAQPGGMGAVVIW